MVKVTIDRAVLEQVLDAFEALFSFLPDESRGQKCSDSHRTIRTALAQAEQPAQKPEVQAAVNRFLGWKLPADFAPDCGISFKRESDYDHPVYGRTKFEPIGTNLFTADQARAMLEHVLAGEAPPVEGKAGGEVAANATDAAWDFANAVWYEMDRKSMPGIYMHLVVQAIVKHYTRPRPQAEILDMASEMQTAIANGDLPDQCEAAADWLVKMFGGAKPQAEQQDWRA